MSGDGIMASISKRQDKMFIAVAFLLLLPTTLAATGDIYLPSDIYLPPPCDPPLENYQCGDIDKTPCLGGGLTYISGWCPGGNNIQCCAPEGTPVGKRVGGPGIKDYRPCDPPNDIYRCYDKNKVPVCPEPGLQYVRGWCIGPNNIQCCAEPGTPEGKRVGGPGIKIAVPSGTKVQDFTLYVNGDELCSIEVFSGDSVQAVREGNVDCNSWVTVKVSPNGDCRDEGEDTCTVILNGGTPEEEVHQFSIQFYQPEKTYGTCSRYREFRCVQEDECKATGGTPVRGYCPKQPEDIKCCIYQASFVQEEDVFAVDRTGSISDLSGLESKLRVIKEKYNAKIIIEIVEDFPKNTDRNLRNDFHLRYKLDDEEFAMVLLYSKQQNAWWGITFDDCNLDETILNEMVTDENVESNIKSGNYDAALSNFVGLLEKEISTRVTLGTLCKTALNCKKECDSSLFGIGGCSLEKCVNIDGCIWNNNQCENICPGKSKTEVVMIKKDQECDGKRCHDIYLCKNGVVASGYPILVATSRTGALSESTGRITQGCYEFGSLEQKFVEGYNKYYDAIEEAAQIIDGKIPNVKNPKALIAALISHESKWEPNAVSHCAAAGISQFIPDTARDYGLGVPEYEKVVPSGACSFCRKRVGKISACNVCNRECDPQRDERFNPEKSIITMAKYLVALQEKCQTFRKTIEGYNGGIGACKAIDNNFFASVNSYYVRWQTCLAREAKLQSQEQTVSDIQSNLPEEILKVSDKVRIIEQEEGFNYVAEGESKSCNLDPASTGIRGYWIGVEGKGVGECTGFHGAEQSVSCPAADAQKVGLVYSSVKIGTPVTVKDPYGVGESGVTTNTGDNEGSSNLITGLAVGSGNDFEATCRGVCSGIIEKLTNIFDSTKCKNRCGQLGCSWQNEKCEAHPTLCVVHSIDTPKQPGLGGIRKILFIPVFDTYNNEYLPSYNAFVNQINQQYSFFLNALPDDCRVIFDAKIPTEDEFQAFLKGVCPTDPKYLRDLAEQYGYNPDNFDIIVGVGGHEQSAAGSSKCLAAETREVTDLGSGLIWTSGIFQATLAHEMGHLFGLDDQYCSQDAGSTSAKCNGPDSINRLSSNLGCDPKATSGPNACCGKAVGLRECKDAGGKICCLGNKAGSGRSIMSSEVERAGFDANELKQITAVLKCSSKSPDEGQEDDAVLSDEDFLITLLENAILSRHSQQPSFYVSTSLTGKGHAREWAETIVGHAQYKTPEYVALVAAIIEEETKGEFVADPYIDWKEGLAKIFGRADSLGCMQVQVQNAAEIARENKKNPRNVRTELITIDGCVFYGTKYLDKVLQVYAPTGINLEDVEIIAAGYNSRLYGPRNAALQKQLNEILGGKLEEELVPDGIMLPYDPDTGGVKPLPDTSKTEKAIKIFFDNRGIRFADSRGNGITIDRIRAMLLKENGPGLESEQVYKEIKKAWKEKNPGREPDYSIIPQLKKDYWDFDPRYHDIDVPMYASNVRGYYLDYYCSMAPCGPVFTEGA